MEKQHIMEQFAALAKLAPDQVWEYSALGDAAIRQVRGRLREGAEPEGELLDYLCAVLCFYRFCLLQEGGEESVRAGDITVVKKQPGREACASRLLSDALALAKDFLTDEDFYFRRTGG